MFINVFFICISYLIGSISSAIIVCKLWGLPDPRSQGSNNPGATNVLRMSSKLPAIITLLGDGCKGFILTLIASQLNMPSWVIGSVMLSVLLGHIFPVFFNFKGGKGIATAMGAFLGLNWQVGALLIAIWALVIIITRISSLGAIISIVLAPVVSWLLHDMVITTYVSLMSLVLLLRHKDNILRLYRGEEKKI